MLGFVLVFGVFTAFAVADQSVRVHVTILIASNEGDDFNLVNDAYRDQLIELFSYSAYRQIETVPAMLNRAERVRLPLPDDFELVLTLQGTERGRILVQSLIRKDGLQYLDTILSILDPGVVFLGGPPAQEGSLIIVLETGI